MPDRTPPPFDILDEPPPVPHELEARVRAWQMTGDPAALWPELGPRDLQPAADAIGRAVAAILAGASASLGRADGRDAYAVGIAALVTGTGPLLGYWMERGLLDASEPLGRLLARHLAHGRRRAAQITRTTVPVLAQLSAAGLTPTVIKGFHTAHAYYPEAGLRPLGDVDVVVAPADVRRAESVLCAAGFTAEAFVNSPYKRDFYPPDDDGRLWSLEMWHARDRWRIELHDGLNFGEMARYGVRLDAPASSLELWDAPGGPLPDPLRVPVHVAAQPLLIAALATHLTGELYSARLLRLVELTLVIRRDRARGTLDWDAAEELLRRTGATRFAYPAFALVERLAPGTVDGFFLARARASVPARTRAVTDRFTPTSPILQDRVSIAERFMFASGALDTLMRAAQMALPLRTGSWPTVLRFYHRRFHRLLTGRISWNVRRAGPADDADGSAG